MNECFRRDLALIRKRMVEFSAEERRAFYRNLSTEVRSALWREHLSEFRANNAQLSDEQRAFVDRVLQRMSDLEWFAIGATDARWPEKDQELRSIDQEARRLFPLPVAAALIADLGPQPRWSTST